MSTRKKTAARLISRTKNYTDRASWLADRKNYIGGSEIAAILGLSHYRTSYDVYASKVLGAEPDKDNQRLEAGRYLESGIITWAAERHGWKAEPNDLRVFRSVEYPLAACTPDAWVGAHGLEVKTAAAHTARCYPETVPGQVFDVYPGTKVEVEPGSWNQYMCQVQWSMAVTGAKLWYLAAAVGYRELRVYAIHRDEEDIEFLLNAGASFWKCVEQMEPPPMNGAPLAALRRLHPEGNGETVELSSAEETLAGAYLLAKAEEASAKKAKEWAQARLQAALGDSSRGVAGDRVITWSDTKAGYRRFNVK